MDCEGLIKSDVALIRGVLATDWGWSGLVGTVQPLIRGEGVVRAGRGWSTTGLG